MRQVFLYKDKNDYQVWEEIKCGNELAFEIIFKNYYELLVNYGLNIIADQNLVEDLIQDFFANIWKKRERLSNVHSIKFYLLVSFRRLLFKKIAKESKISKSRIEDYLDQVLVISREQKFIDDDHNKEQKKIISKNIGNLSSRQKEIIYLKFYKNLSYQEISVIMNINYQSARNLLFAAIKTLRINLSKSKQCDSLPKNCN